MRPRAVGLILIGVLAVAGLAGCGDDDDNVLTRAGFLAKGNAFCKSSDTRIKEAADRVLPRGEQPRPPTVEAFAKNTVIPELKKQVDYLEKLEPNPNDRDQVKDIIASAKNAVEKIDDDPTIIMSEETDPLSDYADRSDGFGLRACGDSAKRVGDLMTGKESARQ